MGKSKSVGSAVDQSAWLHAEGTLGAVRMAEALLPIRGVAEHSVGKQNANGKGDHSFLDALRLGYSYQLYVGAILLAHGLWVRLPPLSVRPDARAGRSGSHSDEYDLLAGVNADREWGTDQYAEVERRILRVSGIRPDKRVESLSKGGSLGASRRMSFSLEIKARGQDYMGRDDFPFDDLILEPEARYRARHEGRRWPDVWGCVSQVTGQVIWYPSRCLGATFEITKQGRQYRTAPIKHFLTTEELSDYLSLRNDDLTLDDV